ncbi:MAG: hypothetical protein V7K38_24855 [Nostoc sp.]|uniref:hypothetical protein n=1 Tax=Nostoc sp. TaxID=1180 RepID=UPI002FFA15FB
MRAGFKLRSTLVCAIALHLLVKKERSLLDRIELKLGILSKAQVFAVQNGSDWLPGITLLKF